MSQDKKPQPSDSSAFEKLDEKKQLSLAKEFLVFIVENKAWWMIPIVFVFGLVGLLVALVSTGAAPFIYTLF